MSKTDDLVQEIAKLNIILYHRENGLSHPDLQGEIDKSILAEENKRLQEAGSRQFRKAVTCITNGCDNIIDCNYCSRCLRLLES
ncbi:hypothetical protein LCGC14_1066720 [marine sediment metagenome]|uniref:Uncharacterized protein n=1 Tax=marine sediment metagenome TaxID=412755 RepID=A0A0F9Q2H3_9ZZZZ